MNTEILRRSFVHYVFIIKFAVITVLCPTALITNRSEEILSILLLLLKINTLKLFIDLLDGLEIQKKLPTLMTF